MKLYTKTGDKGLTGLIGGTRIPKNDIRIETYGTVDELNSFIGLLTTYPIPVEHLQFLRIIQRNLFTIGSYLATDKSKTEVNKLSVLSADSITKIEQEIDKIDENLPELSNFILPGSTKSAAFCHICRTISRRTERKLYEMNELYEIDNQILIYVNRLSDYFFALSRLFTIAEGGEEIYWKTFE